MEGRLTMTLWPTLSPAGPVAVDLTEPLIPTGPVFFRILPVVELPPPEVLELLGLLIVAVPSMIFPPFVPLDQLPALGSARTQKRACASAMTTTSVINVGRGSATSSEARK